MCVFNVETGELLSKYCHKNKNQDLFSVAWTKTENCGDLLATGSSSGEIRLYHVERNVSIHHWTETKNLSVNAVQFHPDFPNYLFAACKEGAVKLWDIGDPAPPYYEKVQNDLLITLKIPGTFDSLIVTFSIYCNLFQTHCFFSRG